MKKQYGNRVSLIYTDTGSLVLNIQTEDLYQDFQEYEHHLDLIGNNILGMFKNLSRRNS